MKGLFRPVLLTALLLTLSGGKAQTETDLPAPQPPVYPVVLSTGVRVQVAAPPAAPHPDAGWITWSLDLKRAAPNGRFVALLFLRDAVFAKDHTAAAQLVRPDGSVLDLPKSDVNILKWTPDSRYLLGAGPTTLRLWNTAGGVRLWTGARGDVLDATARYACVAEFLFEEDGVRVTRLRLPTLSPAGTFVLDYRPTDGERFCR
ncbi:hypothetical protein GO986_04210 [Deinococcus sp. HMF7620]|uniref:WD40 repeat domain-containing protein n=1 Tax=Deinococcus arboris TaxID=2682977 RepID=A0A7C9M6Z5_9DEIO|nr:hypothetical protein [Deinococcus arboris]MVN85963.1 hypothetical protein [Deinococcus arboris]